MSNRIAVMNDGKIQQIGGPDGLYYEPVNSFVAQFVGENNRIEAKVEEIRGRDVILQSKNKKLVAVKGDDVANGEVVNVFIRPEMLRLFPIEESPGGFENLLKGKVDSIIFEGQITRYDVKTENDLNFTVSVPNTTRIKTFQTGREMWVVWSKDNALVLRK